MEPLWPHLIQQCVDWLIPFGCGGLAGWTARTVRQLAALKTGMQDLLRAQLIQIHGSTVAVGRPVPSTSRITRWVGMVRARDCMTRS